VRGRGVRVRLQRRARAAQAGVRELADVVYLTNEYELGDFGVGGMIFTQNGFVTTSKLWTESLFRERGVRAILQAHVEKVEPGRRLLRAARRHPRHPRLRLRDAAAAVPRRPTSRPSTPTGRTSPPSHVRPQRLHEGRRRLHAQALRGLARRGLAETYQTPTHANVFAVGIAFAPPHQISQPRTSVNGTLIAPSPPRTGMPSGVMGKASPRRSST
jgi:sulfide:quinone oxidoreductase